MPASLPSDATILLNLDSIKGLKTSSGANYECYSLFQVEDAQILLEEIREKANLLVRSIHQIEESTHPENIRQTEQYIQGLKEIQAQRKEGVASKEVESGLTHMLELMKKFCKSLGSGLRRICRHSS